MSSIAHPGSSAFSMLPSSAEHTVQVKSGRILFPPPRTAYLIASSIGAAIGDSFGRMDASFSLIDCRSCLRSLSGFIFLIYFYDFTLGVEFLNL